MKSEFIQIRVTADEKRLIAQQAQRAGMDVSQFLLAAVRREAHQRFVAVVAALSKSHRPQLELAELNDLLTAMSGVEVASLPRPDFDGLSDYHTNFIAATVEFACSRSGTSAPPWVRDIAPLREPVFATALVSLRPHLLRVSPPPFRSRNIFVDSSIGARV